MQNLYYRVQNLEIEVVGINRNSRISESFLLHLRHQASAMYPALG